MKQVIMEDELEEDAPRSHYKAEGKMHEMERDVAKFWKKQNVRIAFYGIENQAGQVYAAACDRVRWDGIPGAAP